MPVTATPHPVERALRRLWLARGFRSEWHTTSLGRLHVLTASGTGRRPSVVAVHGIGSGALPFLPVLNRLRAEVTRVVAIESPGHGFSDPPREALTPASWQAAVHEALDGLREPRFLLLGNSLGGALALRYALLRPERLAGLMLCSPAGAPLTDAQLGALRERFGCRTPAATRALLRDLFARPPWYAALGAPEIARRLKRPYVQDFLAAVGPDHFLTTTEVSGLSVPTLLVWGSGERLLPSSVSEWYRAHLPATVKFESPPIGHVPQLEHPDWLTERLRTFLTDL